MSHIKSITLFIIFTFIGILNLNAAIYKGKINNKLSWEVNTETETLSITSNKTAGQITIPNYEYGETPWYSYREHITTIIIDQYISHIGEYAFAGLENVNIIIFKTFGKNNNQDLNIDESTFEDIPLEDAVFVIPDGNQSEEMYSEILSEYNANIIVSGECQYGKCGDDLNWILLTQHNNLIVTGSGAMYNYDNSDNRAPWYDNRSNIQTIKLGNNVTTIGNYAFYECTALETVTLSSNAAIGTNAIPATASKQLIINDKKQLLANNNSYNQISYRRTYNNTNWQALYLPYAINYEEWSQNFDVARINNVHQYDDDGNGTIDRTTIEIFYIKSGSLAPNTPYFIKAKATGEATITVSDRDVTPVDAQSEWCASVTDIYTFVGTYNGVSGSEMMSNNYYGMSAGSLVTINDESNSLAPLRWYLKIESKKNVAQASRPVEIRIREYDGTTDIQTTHAEREANTYYDLSGRPVNNPTRGVYILNNKKVFIK